MNKTLITTLLLFSLHFTGCLRTYYPVAFDSSAPPTVFNNDEKYDESVGHINTTYTFGKGAYESENYNLYRLGYLLSNTKKHFNFNIEGFAYTGNYKVAGLNSSVDGYKSFYAFGSDINLAVNFKINQLKFGVGSNLGLGVEFGEYFNFRKSGKDTELIDGSDQLVFLMLSFFPFVNYQISETTSISTQINCGIPGVISPIIQLNSDNYIVWISWVPQNISTEKIITKRLAIGLMLNLNNFSLDNYP